MAGTYLWNSFINVKKCLEESAIQSFILLYTGALRCLICEVGKSSNIPTIYNVNI